MMEIQKVAAIDIGSNSVRLLITDVITYSGKTFFKKTSLTRIPLRLGSDVFSLGYITEVKKIKLAETLQIFLSLIELYDVKKWKACATSALREASNRDDVIAYVFERSRLKINVINEREEASFLLANHIDKNLENNKAYLFADVGGGSTELILSYNNKEIDSKSFKIGTLRILNDEKEELDKIKLWLQNYKSKYRIYIIGSGENINKLNSINRKRGSITREELKRYLYKLKNLKYEELVTELQLDLDQADVIIPTIKIFLSIMRFTGSSKIIIPSIGIADGMIKKIYLTQDNE